MLFGMSRLSWLLLLFAVPVVAGIYRFTGPDGEVMYSDQPIEGAKKIDLDPVQTYTAPPVPSQSLRDKPAVAKPANKSERYEHFSITQPGDHETIWSNEGTVLVTLRVQPPLQAGDEFQLLLNGAQVIAESRSAVVQLQNIDRGSHRLHAIILDASGKEITRTSIITFHLRRTIAKRPASQSSPP